MPIFEFECPRCGHRFEDLLRRSSAKNPPCPECSCVKTERLVSTFAMGGGASGSSSSSASSCGSCAAPSCAGCTH